MFVALRKHALMPLNDVGRLVHAYACHEKACVVDGNGICQLHNALVVAELCIQCFICTCQLHNLDTWL